MASWLQCKIFILLMLLQGCSSLDDINLEARVSSHHLGYQQGVKLDTLFRQEQHDISQHTGFYSLDKGHDAFLARLMLIESAEKTLDLQYYIYRNDETSQLITWSLYRAAERGVRVRLLLDDMQKRDDHGMAMLDAHTNIEIRLFNPHQYRGARGIAMLSDFSRLTRRMHNKSLTADSVASIVGGRNIGNEYFSFSSNVEFGDFDLLLYGNTVAQTADQFDLYWNSQHAIPINMMNPNVPPITSEQVQAWLVQSQLHSQFTKGRYNLTQLDFYRALQQKKLTLNWGHAELWFDSPDKVHVQSSQLVDNLSATIKQLDHSLLIISPYFVPTAKGTELLVEAAQSGKKITIVTNTLASNDVFAVHGWYAKYRKPLLVAGIELWEIKANAKTKNQWSVTGSSRSSLHAKIMLFDHRQMLVGSMNFDPRSAELNTEMAVMIEQPDYVAMSMAKVAQHLPSVAYQLQLSDGKVQWFDPQSGETFYSEPQASIWRKLGAWLSGLLPIEKQL